MWKKDSDIYVTTGFAKEAGDICLPPCVSRQQMVFDKSENERAVRITVRTMRLVRPEKKTDEDAEEAKEKYCTERESSFFVNPELKIPKQGDASTAVAETPWEWSENNSESMHPFWAVRRMSAKEVEVYNAAKATTTQPLVFNCHMEMRSLSDVHIATLNKEVVNCTRLIEIPCLVNFRPLVEGEELLLEKDSPREKTSKKGTNLTREAGRK